MPADNSARRQHLYRVGLTLVAVGVMFGLAAIWWWALLGMSSDIGAAATATAALPAISGVICLVCTLD
jgi:hypothetical protein